MDRDTRNDPVGLGLVLLASLAVAVLPVSAKLSFADGAGLMPLLLGRGVIGLMLMALMVWLLDASFALPRRLLGLSVLSGLLALGFVATLYLAVTYIEMGLTVLILYLFPVVVALIAHFRGSTVVTGRQWAAIVLLLIGLGLLILRGGALPALPGLGLSLMAMLFTVALVFVAGHLTDEIGPATMNFYMVLWGLLALLLAAPFVSGWALPAGPTGWIAMGVNGSCYVVAWFAFFAGAQRIGVVRASVLGSADPLIAALAGLWVFQEHLSPQEWVGFGLALSALVAFELWKPASR